MNKRILSVVLALILCVSLIPVNASASEPREVLSVFCASDRHGSDTYLESVLNVVQKAGYKHLDASVLIGDTFNGKGSSSDLKSVSSTIQGIIGSNVACYYTYGSHDGSETDDYLTGAVDIGQAYLYGISYDQMTDSSSAKSAAEAFTTWVNSIPCNNKPIFVLSHVPIHKRRNDNAGGSTWLSALNKAGLKHNILFLWAHNHTGETTADTSVYYVAKGGKITAQGNSSATVINFTYLNAGFLVSSSGSGSKSESSGYGYGSVLTVNSDGTITVKKYSRTALYSTNQVAPMTESITVDQLPSKLKYIVNEEELDLTGGIISVNFCDGWNDTVSMSTDGVTVTGFDASTIGVQTLTLTYSNHSVDFDIEVVSSDDCAEIEHTDMNIVSSSGIDITLDILDSVAQDVNTYVAVKNTENGNIEKYSVEQLVYDEESDKYLLTLDVPAKELNDTYEVQLFNGNTPRSKTMKYSVCDYIETVINPDNSGADWNSDELISLCKALGNYGTAFQKYFNYRSDDLANGLSGFSEEDKSPESISEDALEDYEITKSGEGEVIGIKAGYIRLVMESGIITRVIYELEEGHHADEFEFYIDGEACTPEMTGNEIIVSFASSPQNFGTSVEVKVVDKDSANYSSVNVSPLSYIRQLQKMDDESYADLYEACEWIYRYYVAVKNYSSAQTN